MSEDIVMLKFEYKDEFVPEKKTNIVIASFTTAHTRLHRFDVFHHLHEFVFYIDTNSIIYKSSTGEDLVPTGDFLRHLKDNLNGNHILEFVSVG